jgi:signal transduction histidine kinase
MQNFSKYEVSNKGIIALYDTSNILFLRYPWIEAVAGKKVDRPKIIKDFIISKKDMSFDELLSPVDGVVRLSFSKKILNDRFIITVGESKSVVLEYWYKKFMLFTFLLFGSGILFYTFFMKFLTSTIELERKRKETIQAAKLASIGEMTAGIAHEINNPIMIIFGSLKSIKKYLLSDIAKVEQHISKIDKQINRIDRIIKGLKAFSRDSSYENFQRAEVDKIINDSIELIQSEISSNDIRIEIIDDLRNKTIECNEIQIEQVIINIIKNSIDAISGQTIRWIKIHLYNRSGSVIIRITDSGNGVPESIRNKIMNPFFTTKEVGKGTGLGLSISQGIIASHGGSIYLDESVQNTCFVIELKEGMNLDYVIKTHLEFKDNLKNYILNPNNSIDKNIIASDKHCEFGKWIVKHEQTYSHLEGWNKTIILHRKFHDLSAEVLQLLDKKNVEKMKSKMHELDLVSDEIVLLIFKLKEHLK